MQSKMLVQHMKPIMIGSWCRVFQRYDLDSSGTVNSRDELEQLTINLVYALKLQVKVPVLQLHNLLIYHPLVADGHGGCAKCH